MCIPVRIPATVYAGIIAVRDSGRVNMLARPDVARVAQRLGYAAAAAWIADRANHQAYADGIFRGFEPEDEE